MSGKIEYTLTGLNCSHCAAVIEDQVKELPWVKEAHVNLATQVLALNAGDKGSEGQLELQSLVDRIESGIKVEKRARNAAPARLSLRAALRKRIGEIGGAILFFLLILSPLETLLTAPQLILLFGLSYLLSGKRVLLAGLRNLRRGRILDENFLMIIATAGAFAIGDYPEAVAVMLFYQLGEFFQDMAVDHSRRSIRNLMGENDETVQVLEGDTVRELPADQVPRGTLFRLRPGDRVPLDAVIRSGEGSMDTSALTGESYPRPVEAGERILSGYVNGDTVLTAESLKSRDESAYARILRMVEEAGNRKARSEQFITRFARIYTPVVVTAAALLALLPPLLLEGAGFREWISRALVFLVVSCPCALVVSIPLGFFAGIGRASREGILVKGGNYLEALNRVDTVFLDKTGTLSEGRFMLRDLHPAGGFSGDELLAAAAAVESASSHPIALSLLSAAEKRLSGSSRETADALRETKGRGIEGLWRGAPVLIGKASWLEEKGIVPGPSALAPQGGGTTVHLAWDGVYRGSLLLADRLRSGAAASLEALRATGIKRIEMLTGDDEAAAREASSSLPLDGFRASLLPEGKVAVLEEAASRGGRTLFVGDGINDAPVLARADVGIAMGGLGSDAAIEAADVVLMSDDLSHLASARRIAGKTRSIVVQNIVMALGIKGVILALAAAGYAGMGLAVFGDVGVALLAVLNVLRIMSDRGPTSPNGSGAGRQRI